VTYSDGDMPTHYGFKSRSRLDAIASKYERLSEKSETAWHPVSALQPPATPEPSANMAKTVAAIIDAQDERGAWVEPANFRARSDMTKGAPSLTTRTFNRNILTLARFIAAESAR